MDRLQDPKLLPFIIDAPAVCALMGITYGTLDSWLAAGRFPKPLAMGGRRRRWLRDTVLAALDAANADPKDDPA